MSPAEVSRLPITSAVGSDTCCFATRCSRSSSTGSSSMSVSGTTRELRDRPSCDAARGARQTIVVARASRREASQLQGGGCCWVDCVAAVGVVVVRASRPCVQGLRVGGGGVGSGASARRPVVVRTRGPSRADVRVRGYRCSDEGAALLAGLAKGCSPRYSAVGVGAHCAPGPRLADARHRGRRSRGGGPAPAARPSCAPHPRPSAWSACPCRPRARAGGPTTDERTQAQRLSSSARGVDRGARAGHSLLTAGAWGTRRGRPGRVSRFCGRGDAQRWAEWKQQRGRVRNAPPD